MTSIVKRRMLKRGLVTLSIILVIVGFALDGITEIGHHLAFIAGGMAIGYAFGTSFDGDIY